MKRKGPIYMTIGAVMVAAMILVVLLKEGEDNRIVRAIVYTFIVVSVGGILFFAAKNPDMIAQYGIRKRKGRVEFGKIDYSEFAEEQRKNVAGVAVCILSVVMLCVAIFL